MSEPPSPEVLAEGQRFLNDAKAHGKWPVILYADHPWAVWLNDHGDTLLAAAEERGSLAEDNTILRAEQARMVKQVRLSTSGDGWRQRVERAALEITILRAQLAEVVRALAACANELERALILGGHLSKKASHVHGTRDDSWSWDLVPKTALTEMHSAVIKWRGRAPLSQATLDAQRALLASPDLAAHLKESPHGSD